MHWFWKTYVVVSCVLQTRANWSHEIGLVEGLGSIVYCDFLSEGL